MKFLFSTLVLAFSLTTYAAHHEEGEKHAAMHENNFVYISTYTQPAGGNPERLKKSLLENIATLEENGYNSCGMLRHQFGGGRSFMTYCYFDDWDQFAKINDSNDPVAGGARQLFGDHTDNIVAVVERNLTTPSNYVLEAKYSFGPYLTDNERRANAKILFDVYNEAFGGCNLAEHFWGPELTWNFYCGYDSYADWGKKVEALSAIHEERIADLKLDVMNHSDHLMTRVKR
ncbi:hypothetical protein OAN54_02010 [Gammaproteobacteria bacterium]|jgi:hypothetical protein|nr:hypothetical protein [Gammaproteobacteria bacterium]MDC0485232.1 hypothetical protein [Gammaproteobacteria bacterium]